MRATLSWCGVLLVLALKAGETLADDPFVASIEPLIKTRCVKCHGPNKPKGGLDLSTPAGFVRGGKQGAAVTAGNLDKSLIWQRVSDDEMPPEKPLTADEKQTLKNWIAAGARGLPAAAEPGIHFAFRALTPPAVPKLRDGSRVRNGIDQFVLAKLEQRGLSLGPDADRETLIRRLSLDLTGLPPTPDEVKVFLDDNAEGAYERLVERTLASPRCAERWGKHWLDAAGYADSNGYFSADTDRPLAWRYRDYVIRAFHEDKPFDRFIREQLAGDELISFTPGEPTTPEGIELLAATHFLRNGQDGTDIGVQEPEAFEIDRRAALEAAVQVTASSLLGLTVHCARCHDHKFEPITQREYYQLQAVLFPAFNPNDWVNPKDRTIYAYLPGEKEEWQANEKRLGAELAELRREFTEWRAAHREPADLIFHEEFSDESWKTRWSNTAPGDDAPGGQVAIGGEGPHAARTVDGALQVIAGPGEAWLSTVMPIDWTPEGQGHWIQVTFDLLDTKIGGPSAERIGYVIAAHDFDDSSKTAEGNLLIDGHPTGATSIYQDYPGGDQKVVGQIGSEGHVAGRNYGVRVTNIGEAKFRLEHIVDGLADGKSLERTAADLPDGGFALFYCTQRSFIVDDVRIERSLMSAAAQPEVARLRELFETRRKEYETRRTELESKRTPEPGRAIAWVSEKSNAQPEVPLLTRGLYHLKGESVPPGALQMLTDPGREMKPQPQARSTGNRLGFAEWLLHPGGRPAALLARVHVNRIWRQYFGRGIVPTTDNLGQGGAAPENRELLEHLALTLVENKWSQKSLHRHIVTSSVYRQSSLARPEGLEADVLNRTLWRFPVRRMEAEVLRDSMLQVSGLLDLEQFGPYVPSRQTAIGEVVVDAKTPGAHRRSLWLQQRRSQILSMLKVFDAPAVATVCTSRPSSTVPLQSLALLNSEFSTDCATAFATRIEKEVGTDDAARVRHAWRLAISRAPTEPEERVALDFLAAQRAEYTGDDGPTRALADLCQMLLASNAFLYVE